MAYQFADGFDNYGNATTLTAGYPWDFVPNSATISSTADFRFSPPGSLPGGCITNSGSGNMARKILSGNISTLIVGFGFKCVTLPASGQQDVCGFLDTSATMQSTLCVNTNGALQFFRGDGASGGTAIGTATPNATVVANAWVGLSLQVTFSGSSGSAQLFVNGSPTAAINSTSLNNIVSANSFANQVGIGNNVNANVHKYDDFYCFDTTGITLNALPGGDIRILTKLPASAGNYTNWTPTGLASNFQNVAVTPPSTADFNANNVATTKDSYTMQSAGLAVPPFFVLARASMERDDAGPHTPSIFIRSGSTDSSGVVTPALGASYLFYDAVFATDPNTGLAWTGPNADNAQAGVIEG